MISLVYRAATAGVESVFFGQWAVAG